MNSQKWFFPFCEPSRKPQTVEIEPKRCMPLKNEAPTFSQKTAYGLKSTPLGPPKAYKHCEIHEKTVSGAASGENYEPAATFKDYEQFGAIVGWGVCGVGVG